MSRFTVFGFMPICFDSTGSWAADTGSDTLNKVCNPALRGALFLIDKAEDVFDIVLPIRLVAREHPGLPELVQA